MVPGYLIKPRDWCCFHQNWLAMGFLLTPERSCEFHFPHQIKTRRASLTTKYLHPSWINRVLIFEMASVWLTHFVCEEIYWEDVWGNVDHSCKLERRRRLNECVLRRRLQKTRGTTSWGANDPLIWSQITTRRSVTASCVGTCFRLDGRKMGTKPQYHPV